MTAPLSPDARAFAGLWAMQPEQAEYDFGLPPQAGSYRITLTDDAGAVLQARSLSRAGRARSLTVTGRLDAVPRPISGSRLADHIRMWLDGTAQMRSEAFREGRRVMWATRRLNGASLAISVHGRHADGRLYRNTDHYIRAQEAPEQPFLGGDLP